MVVQIHRFVNFSDSDVGYLETTTRSKKNLAGKSILQICEQDFFRSLIRMSHRAAVIKLFSIVNKYTIDS